MQPLLILSPCWVPPKQQGLCSHSTLLWAPRDGTRDVADTGFVPLLGTPTYGRGCVATAASFGHPEKKEVMQPLLILSPCWGSPKRHGLCSPYALFWAPRDVKGDVATSILSPCWGTPRRQGFSSHSALVFWQIDKTRIM